MSNRIGHGYARGCQRDLQQNLQLGQRTCSWRDGRENFPSQCLLHWHPALPARCSRRWHRPRWRAVPLDPPRDGPCQSNGVDAGGPWRSGGSSPNAPELYHACICGATRLGCPSAHRSGPGAPHFRLSPGRRARPPRTSGPMFTLLPRTRGAMGADVSHWILPCLLLAESLVSLCPKGISGYPVGGASQYSEAVHLRISGRVKSGC